MSLSLHYPTAPLRCVFLGALALALVPALSSAQAITYYDSPAGFSSATTSFGPIDFEGAPSSLTVATESGGTNGVTYIEAMTIEGVVFERVNTNGNVPGMSLLNGGWFLGHPNTYDKYNVGSGNLLIAGLAFPGRGFRIYLPGGANSFGGNFGSVDDPTSCCVQQWFDIHYVDGTIETLNLLADEYAGFELSWSQFTGFTVTGKPIEYVEYIQLGHSPILDNFVWGFANDGCTQLADATSRAGTPPNPTALLAGPKNGPLIGQAWDPVIDHATFVPDSVSDFVLIAGAPANLPIGPAGTLLCNVTSPLFEFIGAPSVGQPFQIPIPDSCSLVGLELCVQGGSVDSALQPHLANALDVTVGTW